VGIENSAAGISASEAAHLFAIDIGNPDVLHRANVVYTRTKDIAIGKVLKEEIIQWEIQK
jgi:hypothetical protein